ncbi:unnamed protein product, partial [Mesorhabditis spiculigera]
MSSTRSEVRIITLEKGAHREAIIHRIQKGWKIRFVRGASLLGCSDVKLKCAVNGSDFLNWSDAEDPLSATTEVLCEKAGAFEYSFTIDEEEALAGSGHLLVLPSLSVNGQPLSLDGVSCITHIVKLLGPLSEWEGRLRIAHESGYNMLHLTPVHRLGISQSAYSIMDHHALNDSLHQASQQATFEELGKFISKIERDWGIITVQDVVWNHAAKNAPWLQEHPECSYNCKNSPHLRPAYALDRALHYFGREVGEGKWENRGVPAVLDNVNHIHSIDYVLRSEVFPKLRFHEFFQCDVEKTLDILRMKINHAESQKECVDPVKLLVDPEWRRFGRTVDVDAVATELRARHGGRPPNVDELDQYLNELRGRLNSMNDEGAKYSWEILMNALQAILGHISYERVEGHGPRKGLVREDEPLLCDYFLHLEPVNSWEEDEKLAYIPEKAEKLMAFNGWVMGLDPMQNFALSSSEVYIRRQLVCWGDSVKLNYGNKPEDTPYLWEYMKTYTEQVADIFHGVRIDNAHSTPIHVAEYLLKSARARRPDLYVFAELFTGSEFADHMFVNRLGITSLIREAMSAPDSHEQGRLIYRFGGDCVGAMRQQTIRAAEQCVAHAMLLDQSHDNPTPIKTRSPWDLLPTAAMVSMGSCAIGSTRGFDEMVRHAIHVVSEKRLYSTWEKEVTLDDGLIKARKILNNLHQRLAAEGYTQVFVDQMNTDIVGITRHNPASHKTVVLVAHTAFTGHKDGNVDVKWIPLGGQLDEILFEMKLVQTQDESRPEGDNSLIGLSNYRTDVREHVPLEETKSCKVHGEHLQLTDFPAGAVVAFSISLKEDAQKALAFARNFAEGLCTEIDDALHSTLEALPFSAFQFLLFSSDSEERAVIGDGAFSIPNYGALVYCGLQGLIPLLNRIREHNDLGHPLCQNLRDGCWLADYAVGRLRKRGHGLEKLADIYEKVLSVLPAVPYYLRPSYFESLIQRLYMTIIQVLNRKFFKANPSLPTSFLAKALLLSTTSFTAEIPGAGLSLLPDEEEKVASLAAGLPHFATGIWRNWGRDTFIALPGCLLAAGRFEEAKKTIVSYAGSLRHGLIPNLLAEGKGARYNCRDATWFWLYAIVRYVNEAPDGMALIEEPVRRVYATDDAEFNVDPRIEPLKSTIVEALQRHFAGISFRERNAGHGIDEHMRDEGFNVEARVDKETGLIHGGNQFNCGTWMDKMGSSEKAGNKGLPATPRDGAAVEIQGLALAVLKEMARWAEAGKLDTPSVSHDNLVWSWSEWAEKIRSNFESAFFVDDGCTHEYVNRKGIIKDTVGSTHGYTDFQLRPNACIAVAVTPELLPPAKALRALDVVRDALMGPLGIKTLDPTDWAYNGFYNNDDDGDDKKTAKGWNYHQGPEWLWVAGYYLKARLAVTRKIDDEEWVKAKKEVETHLGRCQEHITASAWSSLPELTQERGAECGNSCPAQAWSVGTMLEAYSDLVNFQKHR